MIARCHPAPDKPRVARRFSLHARTYAGATPVQSAMRRRLMHAVRDGLGDIPPRCILELGCGPGTLTGWLRATFPEARLTAIDIAEDMIDAARQAMPTGVTFDVADAETFVRHARDPYDLIVSNAAAQWFHDPGATLQRCRTLLADRGRLHWAMFGDGTFPELRAAFASAYAALRRPPRDHVLPMASAARWRAWAPDADTAEVGYPIAYPDVPAFLHAVRRAGASHTGHPARPLSRTVFRTMCAHYRDRFPAPDGTGIVATYHALFLSCAAMSKALCRDRRYPRPDEDRRRNTALTRRDTP